MQCFCGSKKLFNLCCQPYIKGEQRPNTPEQLMRSRFSAYAVKNGQYIYDTYARETRVTQSLTEIQSWANECVWLALIINESDDETVDFSAYYIANNKLCHLREVSRFVVETGTDIDEHRKQLETPTALSEESVRWVYLDGDITNHQEITNVKRNDLCPCNKYPTTWVVSKNKKYKQCCGK